MTYQPPVGARDLLPIDVAQKRWVEDQVQRVFHHWGYQRIITSTLERLETLIAGGAVHPDTVIQLQDTEGEVLGLRSELTASIARTVVTRMAEATDPHRLYYLANVFRRAQRNSHNRQYEFYQAGVELLGAIGLMADAEILLLLTDCLNQLNLGSWYLILGEAGLTQSLLSPFPTGLRETVRGAIASLDRITLETLPLDQSLRDRALMLMDLRGKPADVLQQVSHISLDPSQQAIVNHLKALTELLPAVFSDNAASLILDLSLIQTFDYYTGIVFEVVSDTSAGQRVLGQGGRYDQLLSLYHPQGKTCAGIGFSLNTEELHQVLLMNHQLPTHLQWTDWLIVPTSTDAYAAALRHAQELRHAGALRVELDTQGLDDTDTVRDYAHRRHIKQIAWVEADGSTKTELLI